MKTLITITLFSLVSLSALAQHGHQGNNNQQQAQHQHTEHLEILISHYMEAKNALVHDDFKSAKEHMDAFAKEVQSSSEMNHHKEHSEKHAEHHGKMVAAVKEASEAKNINQLRAAFKKVSEELITAVQNQDYDEKLFRQYCPMFEGGSAWLSKEKEVQNPFFGQGMHSCGDSSELIHQKDGS